jgi:hypothetical protein
LYQKAARRPIPPYNLYPFLFPLIFFFMGKLETDKTKAKRTYLDYNMLVIHKLKVSFGKQLVNIKILQDGIY